MEYKHGMSYTISIHRRIGNATVWQRLKDRFRGYWNAWKKRQWFDSIYDHAMPKYVKRVRFHFIQMITERWTYMSTTVPLCQ